jgi:hypothetical protein
MVPTFLRWSERGYRAYGPGHKLIDLVVGGHAQGDVLIPIFFGCWMAYVMQQTSEDVRKLLGKGKDLAAAAGYADDGATFGHGCLLWRKCFRADFAKKDNQYVDSGRTLEECVQHFVEVGMVRADYRIICSNWSDDWSEEEKELARKGGGAALPRGVKYLGMPCGNRAYVTAAVERAAARGAAEDVHALRKMGNNSQEKMLNLKHCISSKLAHIARWGPACQYEEVTASLQRAIEETIRDVAKAPSEELFPAAAMELARLPTSMGGLGVGKLTRDSAAVAGMCSAASALARMGKAWAKRDGLGWICKLIEETLSDPAQALNGEEPADGEGAEGEGRAAVEDGVAVGGGDGEEECEGAWSAEAEQRARVVADTMTAARVEQQAMEAARPLEAQSVRLTILLGAEVATQWRAKLEAMRGEERVQVDGLVTTVIQVPGEAEPRVVTRDIPETLSDMVEQAGKDNNHLQKKVNVHEAAFTWVRRYKTSKSQSERRRLQDLLLPGSSAVFTAVPSSPRMRVGHEAYAFTIRQRFSLPALLCAWHHAPADELVQQMTHHYKVRRHDGVVDAVLLAALDSDLVVCREVAKHFQCPYGSGEAITPDGAIVLADGTVVALDVTVIGNSDVAKEQIRRKTVGWGSLGALERALRARADTWERVRRAEEDGTMSRREAEEERQKAATLVQQAWSGGYKRACEVGGAIFVVMALTPYGGWHRERKDSAESWTRRTTHTGDDVGYYEFDQRFEHPGRTWASATHRAFSFACVGAAMANETWKFVQAKSKQAMKQVLGIRDEKARMTVTPPLAMAPVTQEDDMRWNPNDDGIVFNP